MPSFFEAYYVLSFISHRVQVCQNFKYKELFFVSLLTLKNLQPMDAHRGVRWGGSERVNIVPPSGKFQNTCTIKPKIRGPPQAIFHESLDPLGILAKTSGTPSPGFSTLVHLCIPQP